MTAADGYDIAWQAAQAFEKIPTLHALAPNGSEPPFAIEQGVVLVFFVIMGILSVRRFRPTPLGA